MSEEGGSAAPGRFDEVLSVKGATTKATRERQRRIRLNDSFTELAKALDPGKAPKTDKASIVADAIRVVNQLRTENSQLQQLNKFLEERVSTQEKARSDIMMRQAMYHGLNQPSYIQPQMMPGVVVGQPMQGMSVQHGVGQASAAAAPPHQGHPPQSEARRIQIQQQHPCAASATQQQQQHPGTATAPPQHQQQQASSSSRAEVKGENEIAHGVPAHGFPTAPSAMGHLNELLNSDPNIFDWALGDANGSPPEHGWLHMEGTPHPDAAQDSLRRPPAA